MRADMHTIIKFYYLNYRFIILLSYNESDYLI